MPPLPSGAFYSAKIWVGDCPPTSYTPETYKEIDFVELICNEFTAEKASAIVKIVIKHPVEKCGDFNFVLARIFEKMSISGVLSKDNDFF